MRRSIFIIAAVLVCAVHGTAAGEETPPSRKPAARKVNEHWHWFDATYIRPVKEIFKVRRWLGRLTDDPVPAIDVNPDGEVPDSAFFKNRDLSRITPAQLARGPNTDDGPVGNIRLTRRKSSGGSPGFFGTDERGVKYLFKCDRPEWPEMITGAEIVGNRLMWGLGYNVPEAGIITMRGTGTDFDGRRAVAIKFVPGEILGPYDFAANRDLRVLRALKVASAWINNTDVKEPNSLLTWQNGRAVPYLIDFSNCLGSHTLGPKKPSAGWERSFDLGAGVLYVVSVGLWPVPYDRDEKCFSRAVGRFDSNFDPDKWKPNATVVPFLDITEADAAWMARKISAFTDEHIRAAVSAAKYSNKADSDYIAKVLMKRRDIIVSRYLGK